ncbi:SDR family NAD(P)-dependent oxidoreductase [Streptomyces sp. LHD-70]|uniref:NAD-dependent epimerase/dehydratase family protein n=1 Tax=Streptomyces sp. LHD-70 TaxID=3072140 RepID=UPI00280C5B31|nr:SDR family NAD(P)-dependent oxidoreductase [Streptomyces sp. LHD-70]MDQ8706936.1 SDR family NAD(P)-dependent oxidoreductase [Streptomyces sp. LHD-70]
MSFTGDAEPACTTVVQPHDVPERSAQAFHDYLAVRARTIDLPQHEVRRLIDGRTIVVTGAAGCIGRALLRELAPYAPRRIIGVGLEEQPDLQALPEVAELPDGVEHITLDIRDADALTALLRTVRCDLVFHLAAQRDPGLAEREVARTVTTNVLGTRNVIDACTAAGTERLVHASTGKALRPYTSDVYAQSKRTGEWLVADAAARSGLTAAAVRFTHVVDNAIVLDRFRTWCRAGEPLRLHGRDTVFYVQSARESAQLLLAAALTPPDGLFRLYALHDLGWPVALYDLALGAVAESGRPARIEVVGPEPGYEKLPYPGVYDPRHSGDVSPLINGLEAPRTVRAPGVPDVDCAVGHAPLTPELRESYAHLAWVCDRSARQDEIRGVFDALAWSLLGHAVATADPASVRRITRLTEPHRPHMSDEHLRIDGLFRKHSGAPTAPDETGASTAPDETGASTAPDETRASTAPDTPDEAGAGRSDDAPDA